LGDSMVAAVVDVKARLRVRARCAQRNLGKNIDWKNYYQWSDIDG
jgi:hypothetical protein